MPDCDRAAAWADRSWLATERLGSCLEWPRLRCRDPVLSEISLGPRRAIRRYVLGARIPPFWGRDAQRELERLLV
jgi:hypothetical protein